VATTESKLANKIRSLCFMLSSPQNKIPGVKAIVYAMKAIYDTEDVVDR
jgi:hypothetical protein